MKIAESLHLIPIHEEVGGVSDILYPSLILDNNHGATLIDTGLPGRLDSILQALEALNLKPADLKRIILTHQDLDHVGNAATIVRQSRAEVWASVGDAPVIEGRQMSIRHPPPNTLKKLPPAARRMIERGAEPVTVDRLLTDGELLELIGGIRVVHTPGHTPGHISLYLEQDRVILAGDALTVRDGILFGPREALTPDMPEALRSIKKLAQFDAKKVIAFHGGIAVGNIHNRLM